MARKERRANPVRLTPHRRFGPDPNALPVRWGEVSMGMEREGVDNVSPLPLREKVAGEAGRMRGR